MPPLPLPPLRLVSLMHGPSNPTHTPPDALSETLPVPIPPHTHTHTHVTLCPPLARPSLPPLPPPIPLPRLPHAPPHSPPGPLLAAHARTSVGRSRHAGGQGGSECCEIQAGQYAGCVSVGVCGGEGGLGEYSHCTAHVCMNKLSQKCGILLCPAQGVAACGHYGGQGRGHRKDEAAPATA